MLQYSWWHIGQRPLSTCSSQVALHCCIPHVRNGPNQATRTEATVPEPTLLTGNISVRIMQASHTCLPATLQPSKYRRAGGGGASPPGSAKCPTVLAVRELPACRTPSRALRRVLAVPQPLPAEP